MGWVMNERWAMLVAPVVEGCCLSGTSKSFKALKILKTRKWTLHFWLGSGCYKSGLSSLLLRNLRSPVEPV